MKEVDANAKDDVQKNTSKGMKEKEKFWGNVFEHTS